MGTWGDKPRSRWKPRRLFKRFGLVAAVGFLLFMIFVVAALWALSSEGFWKRYIIPRYVGDYWETVLTWEKFTPRSFPPGFTIEGLRLNDPNAKTEQVLMINRADVRMEFSTRPDQWDVASIELEGVDLNLAIEANGKTNLQRAIDRLFDGMAPRRGRALTWEEVIPVIDIESFSAEGFALHVKDLSDPTDPTEFHWVSEDRIYLTMAESGPISEFKRGRLTDYARVGSVGRFIVNSGPWRINGAADVELTAPMLRAFPESNLQINARIMDEDKKETFAVVDATAPLRRLPVRIHATAFEDVTITIPDPEDELVPLAKLTAERFDPLYGRIRGKLVASAEWRELRARLMMLMEQQSRDYFRAWLRGLNEPYFLVDGQPLTFDLDANFSTEGVLQYGARAAEEKRPLEFAVDGVLTATNFGFGGLRGVRELVEGVPARDVHEENIPTNLDFAWQLSARERDQAGTLWVDLSAAPQTPELMGTLFRLSVADADEALKPIEWNPFGWGLRQAALSLIQPKPAELPRYRIWKDWEPSMEQFASRLNALLGLIRRANPKNAVLRHTIHVEGTDAVEIVTGALLHERIPGDLLEWDVFLAHYGDERPNQWRGSAHIDGIEVSGVEPKLKLEGNLELEHQQDVLRVVDYRVTATPNVENPVRFSIFQPEMSHGEETPATSYLNLQDGTGRLEIRVDTLQPEILELLRNLDVFGIANVVETPFVHRTAEALGLDPDNPQSSGRTEFWLAAEMDRTFRVSTWVLAEGIPVRRFLQLPSASSESVERFDAVFEQSFALDREAGVLVPGGLELKLMPAASEEPLAVLTLETGPESSIDYQQIADFISAEREQFLAGALTRSKRLRGLVSGLFERLERVRSAMRKGTGAFTLRIPNVDLARWSGVLSEFGIPAEQGSLDLALRVDLRELKEGQALTATGDFTIENLKFRGTEGVLPVLTGDLQLSQEGTRLRLEEFTTQLHLGPELDPTTLTFTGSGDTQTMESDFSIRLENINRPLIRMLKEIQIGGISDAVVVLDWIPLTRLVEMSPTGSVDLEVAAQTLSDGTGGRLTVGLQGQELTPIPAYFDPLQFRLFGDFLYETSGVLTVSNISGRVWETGKEPLVTLDLRRPIRLGEDVGDDVIRLELRAARDLGAIETELLAQPLPLFDRRITGGQAEIELDMLLPGGQIRGVSDLELPDAELRGFLSNVTFENTDTVIDSRFGGQLISSRELIEVRDLNAELDVEGEQAGRVELNMLVDRPTRDFEGSIELTQLRERILDALPYEFRIWAARPDTFLDVRSRFSGDLETESGQIAVTARARNLGLPPVQLESGEERGHPPLHLDLSFVSQYDDATSTILLRDFGAVAIEGPEKPLELRVEPLDVATTPLLRVSQNTPIYYELGSGKLSGRNAEGAGLRAELGPIPLEEYGPLLQRTVGIPLRAGVLSGEGRIVTKGGIATRLDDVSMRLQLEDGEWIGRSGLVRPLEAELSFDAARRGNVARLNRLDARVLHPEARQPLDHLEVRGFYRETSIEDELDVEFNSESMSMNRILQLVDDVQAARSRLPEKRVEEDRATEFPDVRDLIPRELDARVTGQFNNFRFLSLDFPSVEFRSVLNQGKLVVEEFSSRADDGAFFISAGADLFTSDTLWWVDLSLDSLDAGPWFDAFGPVGYRGQVKGEITAEGQLRATGFNARSINDSMRGKIAVQLRQASILDERFDWTGPLSHPIAADLYVLIRAGRLLFELETPWDPDRDLFVQGVLRNPFPTRDRPSRLNALARAVLTTTVGPKWEREKSKGDYHRPRQELIGAVWQLEGVMTPGNLPDIRLRSIQY